ncbi:hotdog fold thioesterase [Serinicoccus kebangsaanensis]|uniref:hotdog fold thioesterase n=1 Tax=Serinicoccus kebangsaanensis TaxID=2602069 RepID=UPI00124D5A20|nr:hotdog fold thioesterase [Serinicoccus kebangsaanensis]
MADTPSNGSTTDPRPEMPRGDLAERMGMQLVEVAAERTVATMPVAGNTQPYGLLHGGASAALAETAGSVAAALHAGEGRIAVGVDLNATHHRAVRDGTVTAVATPLALGRAVASYEIVVSDDHGHRVCTARLTCALRERPPGA